jgi:hypothetical protein
MSPFDKLYRAFAVPPDYSGPLAADFHRMIARRYLKGMTGGYTSCGPNATPEALVQGDLLVAMRHADEARCSATYGWASTPAKTAAE